MTVQELIEILKDQDPTQIVMVEGRFGNAAVDDDWSRCRGEHDGEPFQGFCLHLYEAGQ